MVCGTRYLSVYLGCEKTGHRMVETNPENRFYEPVYGYSRMNRFIPFGFGLSYTELTITPPIFEKPEREDRLTYPAR